MFQDWLDIAQDQPSTALSYWFNLVTHCVSPGRTSIKQAPDRSKATIALHRCKVALSLLESSISHGDWKPE